MARASLKTREGPSIRDFLRYYALVLLQKTPMSAEQIRAAVKQESAENREYRPSAELVVSRRDLRLVLGQLSRGGLISQVEGRWGLTAQGQDRLARYEKQKEAQQNGKERAARRLLKLMGAPGPGETVLDVGTGEGFLAFKLADTGCPVLGIDSGQFDYSKDSIQTAVQKAESHGGAVQFRKASVDELRGMDGSFDYVVTSQAIHCMKDQRQGLEAMHRLLKPGGTFLCMDFLVGLEGFLHHGWHGLLSISQEEWRQLSPQCGLDDVSCHKAGDYLVVRARKRPHVGQES